MNNREFLDKLQKHLKLKELLSDSPGTSEGDVKKFFKKIRKSLGILDDKAADKIAESELILYTDGAARGNPGPAAVGCVLKKGDGTDLQKLSKVIGVATNNIAEYQALIYGLDLAIEFNPEKLNIYSDSELLVKQMKGEYKVKNEELKELKEIVLVKLQNINSYTITHIMRELNSEADALANKALDENSPGLN